MVFMKQGVTPICLFQIKLKLKMYIKENFYNIIGKFISQNYNSLVTNWIEDASVIDRVLKRCLQINIEKLEIA
ncbi:hypothetical protein Avbf_17036 [Armadillidium vulgare]|nr:hypothetical protein Avbf_17036 [Armadillidium vulgare]